MSEAFIVGATRTPVGRRNGSLASVHPIDLGAIAIRGVIEQSGANPADVEDVIFGVLDEVGPQSGVSRHAWLAAGYPEHVPGLTINRACGASQQAVHFAAQGVMSGTQDLVLAGGVANMSIVPIGSTNTGWAERSHPTPTGASPMWQARYGDQEVSQFRGAELLSDMYGISREDMERYALESNRRAEQAIDEGRFDREITPVGDFAIDETVRRGSTLERMAALQPVFAGGRITAAVSSQISDAASAMLIASEAAVKQHGLTPRARIHHMSVRADDPIVMLSAPIPATEHALRKAGLKIDDIDLFEVNEAFAPVPIAWSQALGADPAKINVNGGAIALGHPLGATGTKLMVTLLHELERTDGRYGLQTMCEAGGQANVTIIERL